jgi:hypothetical protein
MFLRTYPTGVPYVYVSQGFTSGRLLQIDNGGTQELQGVPKSAEGPVASGAQKAADLAGLVIMVSVGLDQDVTADGTLTILVGVDLVPGFDGQFEIVEQVFGTGDEVH